MSRFLKAASIESCATLSNTVRSSEEYSPGSGCGCQECEQATSCELSGCWDIVFPPPAKDEGASPSLHHVPVDLRPERGKVVGRGDQRQKNHEPNGYQGDRVHREKEGLINRPRVTRV